MDEELVKRAKDGDVEAFSRINKIFRKRFI